MRLRSDVFDGLVKDCSVDKVYENFMLIEDCKNGFDTDISIIDVEALGKYLDFIS